MKVIRPGHRYEVSNFEQPEATGQTIQFIEKMPISEGSSQLKTVCDGTTNEEVMRVIIDRMQSLQAKFPCKENAVALTHFETGLLWLEKRTAERKARGVEGMAKA